MKTILLLILSTIASHSQNTSTSVWQTRMIQSQIQGAVGIPELVADDGERPSLPIGAKGSRFELWGMQLVNGSIARQELLDTTDVGLYLPTAEVTIATNDPHPASCRSRVDQSFTVSYKIANLLPASSQVPTAATKVLVEHYTDLYQLDSYDGSSIETTTLLRSFEITTNGTSPYSFAVTNLVAPDLVRRAGKERFIVYALADGATPQREIAKAEINIYPISEGSLSGFDTTIRHKALPPFSANIWRSYPATSTWVEVYDGAYSSTKRGTALPATFETAGYVLPDTYTELKYTTFPTSAQPTIEGTKTFVLRASSPFPNESITQGGRVLDFKTIDVGNQITVNGLVTTME